METCRFKSYLGRLFIPMHSLSRFVRLVEAEQRQTGLPWEIVEFLVRMYATAGNPELRHFEGGFKKLASSARVRLPGGIHVDWEGVGGLYNQEQHALVINSESTGDMRKKVLDVLHEIQHYNQHVAWDSDPSFRDHFTSGKRMPPRMQDTDYGDPMLLYEISWADMMKEWVRLYGYANAPHEVDARKFANAHIDEAMGFIEQHF